MMKTTSLTVLIACSLVSVSQAAIVTKTISSTDFSVGRGKAGGGLTAETWTEVGLNVGPGAGYTIGVNVTGGATSSAGPTFPGSVLTTGAGLNDYVGSQREFLVTVTATASTQAEAYMLPNYMTSLNLSQVSIWAAFHTAYGAVANPGFVETTAGHTGASDLITDLNSGSGNSYVENAASYKQLIWDIADSDPLDAYQVSGLSVTRTFTLVPTWDSNLGNYLLIDGFEVLGNISLSYNIAIAPEPSSGLLAMLALGCVTCVRRRRKHVQA